ncbi:hypothetical protein BP6252_05432 [Coleophoma cylindrospora]|uniref:SET-containing protein n=1 Tax=Coleophoma cylindrospora TaxID=1849047 RepID=A0A3D8RTK3_9HELO|nr:hypothetical protein BP6252_05432 [Coleophoma cylindrospora]
MFSTLLERMGSASKPPSATRNERTRASSSESFPSTSTADLLSNAQSLSSTPPTSVGDNVSISSLISLIEKENVPAPASTENSPAGRSLRARTKVGTYNIKALAGTSVHAPTKYNKSSSIRDLETRRRTLSGVPGEILGGALASGSLSTDAVQEDAQKLVHDGIAALDLQWSVKALPKSKSEIGLNERAKKKAAAEELERRKSTRLAGEKVESLTKKISVLGKRSRKTFESGLLKASRELRKLADTNEFAHIDTKPVLHEVWSNGKLVVPGEPAHKKKKAEPPVPASPKKKVEEVVEEEPKEEKKSVKKEKTWLTKGLYAGQQGNRDWSIGFSPREREMMATQRSKPNTLLPFPMWHGQRLLQVGRDFKLPFDICSPLPPGQPKPDEWRKSTRNRFIGDAAAAWKTSKHFGDWDSSCVCRSEEGCDENCQNRIMFYECDSTNCKIGAKCGNRAFADLQERRKLGGKYRIGVEVVKTEDRGYGVRANRCFDPHQIIVEYNGEIITEEECDRRMNEEYKNNECYYLMAFDQNMIIDATTGSMARFVNHSCSPNCKMVKWIVAGKPRMALFAGDKPIMTGEELTYDYNFDPFSAKNVQECRCGSANCRGFLGPRPKDQKPLKEHAIEKAVKAGVKAGKRKLKEILAGDDESKKSPKKRKIASAKGTKRPASSTGKKVTKAAVKSIKRSASSTGKKVAKGAVKSIKRSASSASMKIAKGAVKSIKRSASSANMKVAKDAAKVVKKSVSEQILNAKQTVSSRKRGAPIAVKKTVKASVLKTYGKSQTKLGSRNSTLAIVPAVTRESKTSKTSKTSTVSKKSVRNVVRTMKGRKPGRPAGIKVVKVAGAADTSSDEISDDEIVVDVEKIKG